MDPSRIELALKQIAAIATRETLPHFREKPPVDDKAETVDGKPFDPVTEADRGAETAIRRFIETEFPDHGFIGEETGATRRDADYCWIVDPVDGTRAFIAGLPSWGTLVGLIHKGKPVAGMMHQPFTGETYLATGGKAFLEHSDTRIPLAASRIRSLPQAIMMATAPDMFSGDDLTVFEAVRNRVKLTRFGFDCYAYCMLAAGHIELVMEAGLQPYDILPLVAIIENAGGMVTDWTGSKDLSSGKVIAAANSDLHRQAIETINLSRK